MFKVDGCEHDGGGPLLAEVFTMITKLLYVDVSICDETLVVLYGWQLSVRKHVSRIISS